MGRILVVDDEPGVLKLVRMVLEQDGHEVGIASTGIDGLRRGCGEDWDLVVLDLGLPDLAGPTVLTALLEKHAGLKVIVLSATSDMEARVTCLERGAVDFVSKPFVVRELRARVRSRLDESTHTPTRSDSINASGLTLDLTRRRLVAGGQSIELSPREFLLLAHLMRRQNEVCTRAELLSEVWGYAFDPGSNVVDVTIARLRAKLKADVIETVRHVGYSLIPA